MSTHSQQHLEPEGDVVVGAVMLPAGADAAGRRSRRHAEALLATMRACPVAGAVNVSLGAAQDPVGAAAWWQRPHPLLDGEAPWRVLDTAAAARLWSIRSVEH